MQIKLLKFKTLLKTGSILILLFFLTAFPQISIKGATQGLKTFAMCVLPSIFPFMVISKYIIYNRTNSKLYRIIGKVFNVSSECVEIILLGSLSGYPAGATLICDQVKKKD